MATFILSDSVITNPLPGTPKIPSLDDGIQWEFKASDLSLSNGANVASWVATGPAPIADRTLSSTSLTVPTFATAGLNGKPTVVFNGSNNLRQADPSGVSRPQPFSIAGVCRVDSLTSSARIWGGIGTGVNACHVYVNSAGKLTVVSNGVSVVTNLQPTLGQAFAFVVSFNGENSHARISGNLPQAISLDPGGIYSGGGVGAGGASAGTAMVGAISYLRRANRAYNIDESQSIVNNLDVEYDIA